MSLQSSSIRPQEDHINKTAIITGATAGIGRACANRLLGQGWQVCILGRNLSKVYTAEIIEDYNLSLYDCDYTDLKSVARALNEVLAEYTEIDLCIHSSGIIMGQYVETIDKIETQFQVNYLVQFYISQQVRGHLTPSGKICFVGSEEHRKGSLHLGNIFLKEKYEPRTMYQRTKLCQVLYAKKLDTTLDYEQGGVVLVVHPGTVNTGFGGKNLSGLKKWFWELYGTLREGTTAGEAADTLMKVISYDPYNTQLYYKELRPVTATEQIENTKLVDDLYATSLDMCRYAGVDCVDVCK